MGFLYSKWCSLTAHKCRGGARQVHYRSGGTVHANYTIHYKGGGTREERKKGSWEMEKRGRVWEDGVRVGRWAFILVHTPLADSEFLP